MKKHIIITTTLAFCLTAWQSPVLMAKGSDNDKVCTPTNIKYCEKRRTFTGKKYTTYTVRCSDGAKRTISAWNNRRKWCVGDKEKNCTSSQLKAAKKACRS